MADIQVINHGELQWDAKVNHNFSELNQALEKVGEVTDQLHWTPFTQDGLVIPDGVQVPNGGYNYCTVGNKKFVLLSVGVRITKDIKGANVPIFTLPDNVRAGSPWYIWVTNSTECTINGNQVSFSDPTGNAERQWNGTALIFTALYVA